MSSGDFQQILPPNTFFDHIYITTDELFRFLTKEFDEMPCKLESTENPRSLYNRSRNTQPNLNLP